MGEPRPGTAPFHVTPVLSARAEIPASGPRIWSSCHHNPISEVRAGPGTGRKLGFRLRVKINNAMGAYVFSFFFPVAPALWSTDPSVRFGGEPLFSDQIVCPHSSVWFSDFIAQACEAQLRLCQPRLWVMSLHQYGDMTRVQLCDLIDCSPPGSSVHGDSPGKNTGVGFCALLQGIFPTQGLNQRLPAWPVDSLPSELSGKPP